MVALLYTRLLSCITSLGPSESIGRAEYVSPFMWPADSLPRASAMKSREVMILSLVYNLGNSNEHGGASPHHSTLCALRAPHDTKQWHTVVQLQSHKDITRVCLWKWTKESFGRKNVHWEACLDVMWEKPSSSLSLAGPQEPFHIVWPLCMVYSLQ